MAKQKLLLVEDSEALRNVLAEKLTDVGFEVLGASGGEEGLKMSEEQKPDLILTDIVMFPMDGLEMAKQIRASGEWGAKVHIIALTNQNSTEDEVRIAPLHLDAYLVKAETSLERVVEIVKETFTHKTA